MRSIDSGFTTVAQMLQKFDSWSPPAGIDKPNPGLLDIDYYTPTNRWIVRILKNCQSSLFEVAVHLDGMKPAIPNYILKSWKWQERLDSDTDITQPQTFCILLRDPVYRSISQINHMARDVYKEWGYLPMDFKNQLRPELARNDHMWPQIFFIPFRRNSDLHNKLMRVFASWSRTMQDSGEPSDGAWFNGPGGKPFSDLKSAFAHIDFLSEFKKCSDKYMFYAMYEGADRDPEIHPIEHFFTEIVEVQDANISLKQHNNANKDHHDPAYLFDHNRDKDLPPDQWMWLRHYVASFYPVDDKLYDLVRHNRW